MSGKQSVKLTVGIGASAGGLVVLKELVSSLKSGAGISYIIIQHLDPKHKSLLSEILERESSIPIKDAINDEALGPDTVYVIPPNAYVELKQGTLKLVEPDKNLGSRKSIDHFFRSLAEDCNERCAGIILSGSGSDGTAGLREIKAAGGLALAQNPESAEHRSMPESAIQANVIDKVVEASEIFEILVGHIKHPLILSTKSIEPEKSQNEVLNEITSILKAREEFHLDQYKSGTVLRRLARRMSLTGIENYPEYLQKVREDSVERKKLVRDLLINVTDFFRDKKAFELIRSMVLPQIFKNLGKGKDLRVWVAGCASGEEAYSIAIQILEARSAARKENQIEIFATDIDEKAIQTAREGVYPESIISEVPEEYLEKYFTPLKNRQGYKINNKVRDMISFATHNLATDPPFSHVHLVTCRNVLIYLKKEVQHKILSSFYFALDPDQYLFLGSSETLGNNEESFKAISKKWRIYQKVHSGEESRKLLRSLTMRDSEKKQVPEQGEHFLKRTYRQKSPSKSDRLRNAILKTVVPAMVIVNEDDRIIFNHGNLNPFLTLPEGEPRFDINEMVHPSMSSRLRSALFRTKKDGEPDSFKCSIPGEDNAPDQQVEVRLLPMPDLENASGKAIGIIFQKLRKKEAEHESGGTSEPYQVNQNLEQELSETKEELQNTLEELESSTEELRASHEEALSTNEELQSANEELEASAEELRSLNEELSTVNAQLKDKVQELEQTHNDVENFFSSTKIPTIFLDPEFKIQRYTPAGEKLLGIGPNDIERPIFSLRHELLDKDLLAECQQVLYNFIPVYKEKQCQNGKWYTREIKPYKTEDRRIEGVVLIFQDITEVKTLSKRAESREQQQSVVARLGLLALSGSEPEQIIQMAVKEVAHVLEVDLCKVLKYQPEQKNLLLVAGTGWHEGLVGSATVPDDNGSQAGFTLEYQDPVIVKDLAKEKRFSGPTLLTDHGVVSGISCLINHSDPPYGVLGVHTRKYREFSSEDANFIVSVANMLSTAIRSRETQERVFSSEQKFRTIANSIPQLAWMTDETGYIFWYNERWYQLTGTTPEEMLGWGWKEVHHPDHIGRVLKKFKKHIAKGTEWEDTFPLRTAKGDYRWFLSRAKPIRDKDGAIIHWFGTNTDITEQRELENSLKNAIVKLEDEDTRKNDFLAVLGHELRNPLAAIKGCAEMIDEGIGEPEEFNDILQRSTNNMAKLLDDLLDLSRVNRSSIVLDKQQVNISRLLKDKVTEFSRLAKDKEITIESDITTSLYINGDETRLEQIFSNLLNNAIKFSSQGRIEITAKVENEEVQIEVKDDGVGMKEGDLQRVFEPFFRASRNNTNSTGLGIGLSLVKNLTELHDGMVKAKSKGVGEGATFTVTFPALSSKETEQVERQAAGVVVNPGIVVALIDDNQDILATQTALFKNLGCKVFTSETGGAGVELILSKTPDVAFVDIGLPDIDGYTVASEVRKKEYTKKLVAVSGYGHNQAREKSTTSGFDEHIAKPLTLKDIKLILKKI